MRRLSGSHTAIGAAIGLWLVSIVVVLGAQAEKDPAAAKLKNPTKPTAESLAVGQAGYNKYCKFCHGEDAKGDGPLAPKDTHPPNLIDAKWEHGTTDGELFTNIREGIGPDYKMKAMKTKMDDDLIWNIVNYVRSLAPKTP